MFRFSQPGTLEFRNTMLPNVTFPRQSPAASQPVTDALRVTQRGAANEVEARAEKCSRKVERSRAVMVTGGGGRLRFLSLPRRLPDAPRPATELGGSVSLASGAERSSSVEAGAAAARREGGRCVSAVRTVGRWGRAALSPGLRAVTALLGSF